jgi:transposase
LGHERRERRPLQRPYPRAVPPGLKPRTFSGRQQLASVDVSPAGREVIELCERMLDELDHEIAPIDRTLAAFARRQPGCRALTQQLYGVGAVTATAILAELGDPRRFRSSDDAVRHSGLDVTVWQSDRLLSIEAMVPLPGGVLPDR